VPPLTPLARDGKVVFPVTLVVTILQYTAVYEALLSG
jgi:hypothetical protein